MTTTHPAPTSPPAAGRWRSTLGSLASAAAGVAGIVLFLAWMGGAFRDKVRPGEVPAPRASAAGRTLAPAVRATEPQTEAAVGSIQPKKRTEVASQLLAGVLEVKARPGDRVLAGAPLVTLDDRELAAQQREALAALTAADADLVTRRADFERAKRGRASGAVSDDEFGKVEGAFRVAEAQAGRGREVIARLAVQLTYTKIAASGPGLVAERLVEPGDLATPGKTLLVIYDPADLELHANVPESMAKAVSVGQQLPVDIQAPDLHVTGTVREVVPLAQQATRSVLVKLTLPPPPAGKTLLPGMFGRVEIEVGTADRLWVPAAAVRRIGQLDLVDVAGADGTLTRRFVRVGRERKRGGVDVIEILSGLTAGDRVALPSQ